MLSHLSFLIFFSLLFTSCTVFLKDETSISPKRSNNDKLGVIIKSADYNVDNIHIYSNPKSYQNKIISTQGYYIEQRFWKNKDKRFIVSGSNEGYNAAYIANLDHPLTIQKSINEDIKIISTGSYIRVFGRFTGIEDVLQDDGSSKKLPVLDVIAIYMHDDKNFTHPVWVNLLYK